MNRTPCDTPFVQPSSEDKPEHSALEQWLGASLWFPHLDTGQRSRIRADIIERRLAPGGYVCRKGEPVEHWVGIIEGLVKISSLAPDGKSVTFTGVPPGGWLGEGSLLKDEPRRYDVVALRESRIAYVPRATFQWLLDSSIPFNRFLLRQLNERLGQFIATVEHDRLLEPNARVARCVAALFNPVLYPGLGRRLAISQEEIGYLCGFSRQRVNQALQALERGGLLRVEYGAVVVLDLEALRGFEG